MTSTINQCLTQLQSDLETALTPALVNVVYGYLVWPSKVQKAVSIAYIGGQIDDGGNSVTDQQTPFYEFSALMGVKHDKTQAQLETAEQSLNSIENEIIDTLKVSKNTHWMKVLFPRQSTRPPSPAELPTTRFGEVFIRLVLK